MSVTQHERLAATEEHQAANERASYDPYARRSFWICSAGLARADDIVEPCWREDVNPTQHHLRDAQRLHAMATQQEHATGELLRAETRACAGVSEHNRESSPFDHAADIVDVDEIAPTETGHRPGTTIRGIRVVFRPVVGLTVDSLQRIVDCHVARNASMGHQDPEMHDCLLVPPNLHVHVEQTPRGLAVDTTSDDAAIVADLRARANRLRARVPDAISATPASSPSP